MKKVCAYLSIMFLLTLFVNVAYAQDKNATKTESTTTVSETTVSQTTAAEQQPAQTEAASDKQSFHQVLKTKYIQGGVGWMTPILICLILGLGLVIERIIYLNLATTNADKLLN